MTGRGELRTYESHADFYAEAYGQHVTYTTRLAAADATLIEARQCEGDWSDAPTPDLSLAWLASVSVDVSCELGAGLIRTTVRTGEAILIAPGVGSSLQARDAHVIRILAVPYGQLLALAGPGDAQLPQDGDFGRLHGDVLRDRVTLALLEGVWREGESGSLHGSLFLQGMLLQIAARLRYLATRSQSRIAAAGLASWQQRRCTEYLRDNMAEEVDLPTLAGVARLSPFHFARMFKKSLGVPPHRYQLLLRLERAKELLLSTDMSIMEVALSVGYDSPQTLARLFQRELGVTPSAWRRERRS